MKRKKLILVAVSLVGIFTLAGCSGGQDIATMKGGKVTVDDFYDEIKTNQNTQQQFAEFVISKVIEDKYGDKVDQKEADKKFDEVKEQYGDTFASTLAQNGLTEATYKDSIKKGLAFEEALKDNLKVTDNELKEEWKTFHPEVEAQVIQASSEEDAKSILDEIKGGEDFTKIAEEKSTDTATKKDGGKIKFDSAATTLPDEVKEAAFKLKNDEVSDVITTTTTSQTGTSSTSSFYIVKMVKNKDKGNDWKPYKKELTKIYEDKKKVDPTFQQEVITKELKAANIKIKDDAMKNALSQYLPEETKKNSESTSDSSGAKESTSTEASSSSAE